MRLSRLHQKLHCQELNAETYAHSQESRKLRDSCRTIYKLTFGHVNYLFLDCLYLRTFYYTINITSRDAETADPIAATSIKIEHSDAIGAMIAASSSNWTREAYTQQQQQLPPEQNRKRGSSELTSSTISSCNYEGRQVISE